MMIWIIIQAAPFVVPLYKDLSIDLHMQRVGFNDRFVSGSLTTLFLPSTELTEKVDLPENPPYDRMAQAFFHQISITSLSRALYASKILEATVNAEDVPPESPLKLDTKSLATYIPELNAKWPDKNLQVVVDVAAPPTIFINTTGIYLDVQSNFLMNVVLDGKPTKAFLAKLGIRGNGMLKVADVNQGKSFNLTGEIKKVDFTFTLVESFMGNVNLVTMERFLNIIIGRGMVPSANRQLKEGFPIPLELPEGLTIKGIIIDYFSHFIGVGANVDYKAPPSSLKSSVKMNSEKLISFVKLVTRIFYQDLKWTKEMEKQTADILTKLFQVPELLKD